MILPESYTKTGNWEPQKPLSNFKRRDCSQITVSNQCQSAANTN